MPRGHDSSAQPSVDSVQSTGSMPASASASFAREKGLLPIMSALRANDLKEARRIGVDVLPGLFQPLMQQADGLMQLQIDIGKKEFLHSAWDWASTRIPLLLGIWVLTKGLTILALVMVLTWHPDWKDNLSHMVSRLSLDQRQQMQ